MNLPKVPSLADLGLTQEQIQGSQHTLPARASDGKKKVRYQPTRPRDVRVYPSEYQPRQRVEMEQRVERGRAEREQRVGRAERGQRAERGRGQRREQKQQVWVPVTSSLTQVRRPSRQWRARKRFPSLKITPHGEAIAEFIRQSPIFAIDSPTGTGKTRYIPYLMATKGFLVRVAIPTTVAVRDAYRFVREHSTLRVGFAAAREVRYADDDQLVYATTGHFTRRILNTIKENTSALDFSGLDETQRNPIRHAIRAILGDIIIVDEVHTATSQITLLIGLIRYIFTINDQYVGPKIVFSTATFNHGDIMDHFPEFPVYKIDVESKPVTDIYLDEVRNPLRDSPNTEIIRIVQLELERWRESTQKYHGIVFRPGVQEVENTIEFLEASFPQDAPIEFYPAYSSLTPAEIDEIFQPSDRMKVVVGTNIIESGITIEDAGFVIDDMLEKLAEMSDVGGDRLTLSLISRAGSQQRRGRTGRTIEGRNYRLITVEHFNALPAFRQKEIDRVPIFDIVLQLVDAGLNPRDVLKISVARYDQARRLLISFGMIENRADRYYVTDAGVFVSSLSMGVHSAYMVYLGYKRFIQKYSELAENTEKSKALAERIDIDPDTGLVRTEQVSLDSDMSGERILLRTVIAVAAMIEAYGPSYFYVPRKRRDETNTEYQARKDAYIEDYHEKFRGPSDIHTFTNIFWTMMTDINIAQLYDTSTRRRFPNYILEWSNRNSMNNKKLREFLNIVRDVESTVESKIRDDHELRNDLPQREPPGSILRLGKDVPSGGYELLGNLTAEIFVQAYRNNLLIRMPVGRKILYVDTKSQIGYRISQRSTFTNMVISRTEGPDAIIAAQTIEIIGRSGGQFHLAGIIVPDEFFQFPVKSLEED